MEDESTVKHNDIAKILIVDDEPAVCSFLEDAVLFLGMKPKSITRAAEVVDTIKKAFYSVVLLDIFMPEKSNEYAIG